MRIISVQLHIKRTTLWQDFLVSISRDAYVLDALEAAGTQDESLLFRHACHHASCGSCGLRINGREYLPCITPLAYFENSNWRLQLEPLHNFPLIGDLLVDFGPFMNQLDLIDLPLMRSAKQPEEHPTESNGIKRIRASQDQDLSHFATGFNSLENCIECGLCMSACPIVGSDPRFSGPAFLAAAGRIAAEPRRQSPVEALKKVDHDHGLWRCHGAFECSEVCPAGVDPAREIMSLRSHLLRRPGAISEINEG
jgi:succinate dehydrogenase / fumarate reductase, iron-sulfur subunit